MYIQINLIIIKNIFGQTKISLKERAGSHFVNYKESWKFYNAIKSFGENAFESKILFETDSKEVANEKEIELISKFKTLDDEYGYNIQPGGLLFFMNKCIRNKISEKLLSSKKFKENNYKAHAKAIVSINIETKEFRIFSSATEASHILGISRGNISSICRGDGKALSLKGYLFMFKKKFNQNNIDEYINNYNTRISEKYNDKRNEKMRNSLLEKYKKDSSSFNHLRKKVYCVETKEVFDSITDAAKSKNILAPSNIALVCCGKRKTAVKLHWKFLSSTTIPDECKGVESKS